MRGRHNIIGSEVGRPRPPVYMLRTLRLPQRPRTPRLLFGGAALAVMMLIGAAILTFV
jgi:hypothetical protein